MKGSMGGWETHESDHASSLSPIHKHIYSDEVQAQNTQVT